MSDAPEIFFHIAGVGMLVNILFTILLRLNVDADSEIAGQLFAKPVLGSMGAPFLNGKYFIPWSKSPEYLEEEAPLIQTLFWIARIGGVALALGLVGFLVSEVYVGTIGQS